MALEIIEGPDEPGGLPKQFGNRRPIFDSVLSINVSDNLHVNVSPNAPLNDWKLTVNAAPARCEMYYEGPNSSEEIMRGAEIYIEEAIDQLSFIWDYPVRAYRASLLDLSQPVKAGDIREFYEYISYSTPKSRQSNFHMKDPIRFDKIPDFASLPDKIRAALRWYAMGAAKNSDVERFIALWIALELLITESTEAVRLPYRADCGHDIPNCPVCSRPTLRSVAGARIQEFLTSVGGLTPEVARALWRTRQIVHGNNRLRAEDVQEIPQRLGELWGVLRTTLGRRLGARVTVAQQNPFATEAMIIQGTREVHDTDIDISLRTYPPLTLPLQRVEMPLTAFAVPSSAKEEGSQ